MRFLLTGGCGFLGSNIVARMLVSGENEVTVFDNLQREGSGKNLEWLRSLGQFTFIHGDVRSEYDVMGAIKVTNPETIFHLSGQVAMTTSIANPRLDFEINTIGAVNVLEAARALCPGSAIIYSSTNKVYGDLESIEYQESKTRYSARDYPEGFDESMPLDFHSPYGCSKGAADQYMLDYSRIFGLRTVVFRHSSMYGERQFATSDQGWIGWFCGQAVQRKRGLSKAPITISGNGKQVRDLLNARDMVDLYLLAGEKVDAIAGRAYNIGGGMANSMSLIELFDFLEGELGTSLEFAQLPARESDQKVFVANTRRIRESIGWVAAVDKYAGIRSMIKWITENE
jgi:CDP-paratose 2-epimerase